MANRRASFAAAKYAGGSGAPGARTAQRRGAARAFSSTAFSRAKRLMLRPPIGVRVQPPLKIRLEVGHRLEAHGETHQAVGDTGRGARLGGNPAVRGACRVDDGGLDVAEVGGQRDQAGRVDHAPGRGAAALHLEGEHRTGRALLALCERMLRMRLEARVMYAGDAGMGFQPARELE